jgi:hypothetical protein
MTGRDYADQSEAYPIGVPRTPAFCLWRNGNRVNVMPLAPTESNCLLGLEIVTGSRPHFSDLRVLHRSRFNSYLLAAHSIVSRAHKRIVKRES